MAFVSDYLNKYYVAEGYANAGYEQIGISIDWGDKIIFVPKSILLLVQSSPTEVYSLDINSFRLALRELEATSEGLPFEDTHNHVAPITVGGVALARVVEMINGYTVTFEDGRYAVNLVGANSNIGDVVNVNQVSVRSANSAGLTYSKAVEDQSFLDGRIWIDTLYGNAGTQYPRGTSSDPTKSYEDAEDISSDRGLPHRFWLNGVEILSSHPGEDAETGDHANWMGSSPVNAFLVFNGVITQGYIIRRITCTGYCNGNFSLQDGVLTDMLNFVGDASNSGIGGTITLQSGPQTEMITFHNCFSIVPGTGTPVLDCNHATNLLIQFRGYSGGIHVKNFDSPDNAMTIDMISGHAKLDSSCTAGTIVVRGAGKVTDNSGPGCTVVQNVTPVWSVEEKDATLAALSSIADAITLLQKYEENRTLIDKTANTLTVFDDDDITPLLVFSLRDTTGTPSTLEVAERVPQ